MAAAASVSETAAAVSETAVAKNSTREHAAAAADRQQAAAADRQQAAAATAREQAAAADRQQAAAAAAAAREQAAAADRQQAAAAKQLSMASPKAQCSKCGQECSTPLQLRNHKRICLTTAAAAATTAAAAATTAAITAIPAAIPAAITAPAAPEDMDIQRDYSNRDNVDSLLIIFSAHYPDDPIPRFDFNSAIDEEFNVHVLRVRDRSRSWYLKGIRGVSEDFESTINFFKSEQKRLGAKWIYTLGCSMGGYGAIVFGHHLKAVKTIAFSPQLLLDAKSRHQVGCDTYKYEQELAELELWARSSGLETYMRVIDLLPLDIGETQIHMGQNEVEDVAQARQLEPHVGLALRLLIWPGGCHLIAKQLRDEGKLIPLLKKAFPQRG